MEATVRVADTDTTLTHYSTPPGRMSSVTTLWITSPWCSPAKGCTRDTISHTAAANNKAAAVPGT
jgi:hypothetical protein